MKLDNRIEDEEESEPRASLSDSWLTHSGTRSYRRGS
jgi:hypothetical protein